MSLEFKIYNNLTRIKESFFPLEEGIVRFYSCGPTTYDFLHVGNARALVVGDLIYRIFRAFGYRVFFVRNFTDVDDKIINRAQELKVDPLHHSARFVTECLQDAASLGMLNPTFTPKVSETMKEIVEFVEELIAKNHAYVIDGEVFFHVPSFKDYGKLSKKDLESLEHGIRVEVDSRKKHPSDFVLWKPAKVGEPAWDSPWGKGRPGWHIECSAMARKFLGKTIDIHHGGVDLIFPHHENEIAQSESACGCTFSRFWVHNEFLNFGKDKMSKSLGNVVTIRQFTEKFGGEVLRQILSSVHYRSRIDWSTEVIERAINDVERIHSFVDFFNRAKINNFDEAAQDNFISEIEEGITAIRNELINDFNVPGALATFFILIRLINREFLDEQERYQDKKKLNEKIVRGVEQVISFIIEATGLIHKDYKKTLERVNIARKNLSTKADKVSEVEIEAFLNERKEARNKKDYKRSDEIRDQLKDLGISIKDNPDGTTSWSYS